MRDINRLDNFYNILKELHKNIPDWRFGQFMMNFIEWYRFKYKRDIFYIEEDKMIKLIKEFLNDMEAKYA